MKLIDKDVIITEIKKRIETNDTCQKISGGNEFYRGAIDEAKEILSFLDTLEVKEIGVDLGDPKGDKSAKYIIDTKNLEVKGVDLDSERRKYLTEHFNVYEDGILQSKRSNLPLDTYDVIKLAKHFFELGLKAAQKGE